MRFVSILLALQIAFHVPAIAQNLPPAAITHAIDPHATPSSGNPSLAITALNLPANSLAWDPVNQKIYLSIPSAAGAIGNAVQVLDPATGALGANVFAGSEPDLLSVSANSKYLYVGLDGASAVQRMTLPDLALDIKIPIGANSFFGPYYAGDLQASPAADGTMAVVRDNSGVSPGEEGGVVIFDDGAARANSLCGFSGSGLDAGCVGSNGLLFNSIQWNADASVMFAANNQDSGVDFYTVPVTASGFGKAIDYGGLAGGFGAAIHFDRVTKLVYDDDGSIIDPVAGAKVGIFSTQSSGIMVPDGALGTAFFLGQSLSSGNIVLTSFDIQRLTPIATATLSNIAGTPTHLIRWGSNGLAFTTASEFGTSGARMVYILSGSFVAPPSAPQIFSGGVVPVGSAVNTVQSGEWISIYGVNLAGGIASWSGNFPISLGGTSVTIDGKPAYLSYVSPGLINLQVPDDTAAGPVSVTVTTAGGTTTSSVTLAEFAPSLPLLDSKHVSAVIFRSNGSGEYGGGTYDIVGPTGTSLGYPTVAAKAGDFVALFALGLGPTNPAVPAGQSFSGAAPTTQAVTLLINGIHVPVAFSGLSSSGLYQLNFTVPPGLGTGDAPIQVAVGVAFTPSGPSGPVISLQ